MPLDFPGGYRYQSPSLPPPYAYPTPFPMELGPLGPLAYMGLQASGIMPPGIANMSFSPTTDLFTQFQSIQQFQLQQQSMQRAQSADIATLNRYQESFARATGADWNQLQGRAATASRWVGSMLPYLAAVMPEAIDTAMGPRGSQVVMASQLASASRFMYDPSSGRVGMNASEVGQFSDQLYKNLYGTDAATLQMRGVGAGRAGIMLNEMMARGLISSPFQQAPSDAAAIAGVIGSAGSPAGALGGLGTLNTGRIGSSGVSDVADKLRGMTKILTSIQDLFGANGQPNAPIPELLSALDQLGRGAEYKYSASNVESMFRTMQQATMTGRISLPEMSQMINRNAAMLQSVGADPRDAIAMTTSAVNYASAASNVFSQPFYGRMDPRTLAMTSSSLQASSVNSPAGQMAQIALFLADSTTGMQGNSEFGQLASAIRSGATTYAGGKSVLEALQGGNLRSLYTAAGGNVTNFNAAAMNPEVAARYSNVTGSLTRKLQFEEVANMASTFMAGDMADIFGLGEDGQRLAASNNLVRGLFKNAGKFSGMNPQQQAAEIERLAAEAASAAGGGNVDAMRKAVSGRGATLLSAMSGAMSTFTGYDLPGALQAFSPELMAQGGRLDASNRVGGAISSALGDLGRFSFSQRLTNELQNMNPGEDLLSAFSRSLGGVNKDAIKKALGSAVGKDGTIGSELSKAIAAARDSGDPDAEKRIKELMKGFSGAMEGQGIFLDRISAGYATTESASMGAAMSGMLGPAGFGLGASLSANKDWLMTGAKGAASGANKMEIELTGTLTMEENGKVKLKGTGSSEGPTAGKDKK